MSRSLLVIVPTRGRPAAASRLIEAFVATGATADLVFCIDNDDPRAPEYRAIQSEWWTTPHHDGGRAIGFRFGPRQSLAGWTNEVAATACLPGCWLRCDVDCEADPWHCWNLHRPSHKPDWHDQHACPPPSYRALCSMGDDHLPRTPSWDGRLLEGLRGMGGGFVYGNDLLRGQELPTAVAISSPVVAALGWMCLPGLSHYFVDDAWKALGGAAGCLRYLPDVVIEHLHPAAAKAPADATYREAETSEPEDRAAYELWKTTSLTRDAATVRSALNR